MSNVVDIRLDFTWSTTSESAATLLAEGGYTNKQIAAKVGVHPDTVKGWRQHPQFRAHVHTLIQDMCASLFQQGVMRKEQRLERLNHTWENLKRVLEERSDAFGPPTTPNPHGLLPNPAEPAPTGEPGVGTGLLRRRVRTTAGPNFTTTTEEYELDTDILTELRAIEKQAAQELGEWSEKSDIEHTITKVEVLYKDISPEDL